MCNFTVVGGGQVAIIRVLGGVLGMDFRRCFKVAVSHEDGGSGEIKKFNGEVDIRRMGQCSSLGQLAMGGGRPWW